MVSRDFYRIFSAKSDQELRRWVSASLDIPSGVDDPWSDAWRDWLVDFSLRYLSERPLRNVTEQCRYVAFALRYLAAIIAESASPYPVQQVRSVMENRPAGTAALLFGSPEARRQALESAFDPTASLPEVALEPFQKVTLQQFVQRFEERRGIDGYTFDDSTVAKWSRDLVPELERAVVDHFRKTNQVARQIVVRQTLVLPSTPAEENPDRARLVELLKYFEEEPLDSYYGLALKALNDFDSGQETRQRHVSTLRQAALLTIISFISLTVLLALPEVLAIANRAAERIRVLATLNGIVCGLLMIMLMTIGWVSIVSLSDHITRTRTDIQTLEQLVLSAGQDNP